MTVHDFAHICMVISRPLCHFFHAVADDTLALFRQFVKNNKGTFLPPCSDRSFWDSPAIKKQTAAMTTTYGDKMLVQAQKKHTTRKMQVNGQIVKVSCHWL